MIRFYINKVASIIDVIRFIGYYHISLNYKA